MSTSLRCPHHHDTHILVYPLLLLASLFYSSTAFRLDAILVTGNGSRFSEERKERRLGVSEGLYIADTRARVSLCTTRRRKKKKKMMIILTITCFDS